MSTMTPRDMRDWAKEEILSLIDGGLRERLNAPDDLEADEEEALALQRNRVSRLLGFDQRTVTELRWPERMSVNLRIAGLD